MSLSIDGTACSSLHFAGILGSGMSAIAQYLRWTGLDISGSDRLADADDVREVRDKLAAMGCRLFAQDGSGVGAATSALVVSTAIEEDNGDVRAARRARLPVFHRSEVLAAVVATRRTVAVAGTSGKSTVTAMIFELLAQCGNDPSLIGGASLITLAAQGYIGNAWAGRSDLLIIEADESDGTLTRYHPEVTVFLNVSKDHKPVDETMALFATLAAQSGFVIVNADEPRVAALPHQASFGLAAGGDGMSRSIECGPASSTIRRNGRTYTVGLPGRHNAANALAALCVCEHLGCDPDRLAAALPHYRGIKRRFAISQAGRGITVVDDFAHNPEKIRAALRTARLLSPRIVAIFQPHGFGPTRFLKDDLIAAFAESLRQGDALYLLPIYYAGGTARKDVSSAEIAAGLAATPITVRAPADRREALDDLRTTVAPGDCVISMGARDPSLEAFARQIVAAVR